MARKARSDPGWSKHFCEECDHKMLAGFGCEHVLSASGRHYRAHRMCCLVCPPTTTDEQRHVGQNRQDRPE